MTIEEIKSAINSRKLELVDDKKKEAYEYFKEFTDDNDLDNIVNFLDVDIWELIKCNLYLNCKDKDMKKYSSIIDQYKDLFSIIKENYLSEFLDSITLYNNRGKIDELIAFFKANGLINELKTMEPLTAVDTSSVLTVATFKRKTSKINDNFIPFLELIKEEGNVVIDQIRLYLLQSEIKSFLGGRVIEVNGDNIRSERQRDDRVAAAISRELEDFYDVKGIVKKMTDVKDFKEEYERKERNNQREVIELDNCFKELLSNLDNKQIVRYREIIKGIRSPKIKYMFLTFIREHNESYHNQLKEELEKLKQDSRVSIEALLNDYGIPKDSYDFETLPKYSKEELETILKVISKLNITNEEKIRIIKSTTLDRILSLKTFLDKELLLPEFVSSNTSILNEDSKELDYLKENLELLKSYGIPSSIFLNSMSILLNDTSVIRNNIAILNSYNLLIPLSTTSDFRFLLCENLDSLIDKYLELGFEEYLESDLNLLNKKELERVEALKAIGMPINSREELERILNEDKVFFISTDEIKNYLPDETRYVEEPSEVVSVEKLDEYKETNRVYNFNGTRVSIPKVSRLMSSGLSMYQSIISNTHFSEDELNGVIRAIRNNQVKELKMD